MPAEEQIREKALAAFEVALRALEASERDPGAWTEHNLLEALVAITSGVYDIGIERIAAAQRPPTPAEVSSIRRRELLTRAEIRDRFEDLRSERISTWKT
jgi:hypothetical protein